jgi:predicted TPR repeat methyltransferase
MNEELETDLGCGSGLIEIPLRDLDGRTEENHEIPL